MKIIKSEPLDRFQFRDAQFGLLDNLFLQQRGQEPGFNARMFDEDFSRLFRSQRRRGEPMFDIRCNDDALIRKLLAAIETRHGSQQADDTIRELAESIAQSLVAFGRAFYFAFSEANSGELYIRPIIPRSILCIGSICAQWIPRLKVDQWDQESIDVPREIRILDPSKLMRFETPRSIRRMLEKQNKTLAVIDKHQFTTDIFHSPVSHENPNPVNYFNFNAWKDIQELALYRATNGSGWNGRKYDYTKRSDFFDCLRLIRFRRNQLLLRDAILTQLSGELTKVGKLYGSDFFVEISGTRELSKIEHLNELEARLRREEASFKEVYWSAKSGHIFKQ